MRQRQAQGCYGPFLFTESSYQRASSPTTLPSLRTATVQKFNWLAHRIRSLEGSRRENVHTYFP